MKVDPETGNRDWDEEAAEFKDRLKAYLVVMLFTGFCISMTVICIWAIAHDPIGFAEEVQKQVIIQQVIYPK